MLGFILNDGRLVFGRARLTAVGSLLGLLALSGCRHSIDYPDTPINPEPAGTGGRPGSGGSRAPGAGSSGGSSSGGAGGGPATTPPGTDGGSDTSKDAAGLLDTGPGPEAGSPSAGGYSLMGVATWRGNAAGAYTIFFSSVCEASFGGSIRDGAPEMTMRGLRGAFGLVARSCNSGNHWPTLKTMAESGHELVNQSLSQMCLTTNGTLASGCPAGSTRTMNYDAEIDAATTLIRERTGVTVSAFSFPYDVCDPAAIAYLKSKGFVGSRCGRGRLNATEFADPFAINFDLWGPGPSMYKDSACAGLANNAPPAQATPACRMHVLNAPLDEAINKKAWVVRSFHGFATDTSRYEPVAIADYRAHLDVVAQKSKSGELWVAGPSEIIKYRFARSECAVPTLVGDKLVFGPPGADCTKHATSLTYVVNVNAASIPATLAVMQGGLRIEGKKTGAGVFLLDADPTKGDATLVP